MTLLILLIVFPIIMAITCYFLWLNRAGDKTWLIFGKAIALPVLLGVTMLIYELLLVPIDKINDNVNILILHNDKFEISDLDWSIFLRSDTGYGIGYRDLCYNLNVWKNHTKVDLNKITEEKEQDEIYLDLVEATFWKWLIINYTRFWKKERQIFKSFNGLLISGKPFKFSQEEVFVYDPAAKDQYIMKWPEIAQLLAKNIFITDEPIYPHIELSFPPKSKFQVINEKGKRRLLISNKYLQLDILIMNTFGQSALPSIIGDVGEKLNKVLSPSPTFIALFPITIKCSYTPWLRSAPESIEQQQWVKNLIENLKHDFEWTLIQNDFIKFVDDKYISGMNK